jgi:hypothetical protein
MELTPGQRRLVFVVIVLALAGLGAYLLSARGSGGTPAAAPSTPASTAAAPSASTAASTAAGVPPSVLPTPTPASTAGGAEIYQWLPFTPADLTTAAQTTVSFAKAYATWSYTENATAYGATMKALVTPTVLESQENGYETSGVAAARTSNKQVSTGSGTIDSMSAFSANPVSITFVVTVNERVTSTLPTSTTAYQYAVTLIPSGGTWLVDSLALAGVGNQ